VIITNLKDPDGGTAFPPKKVKKYFTEGLE
jgi:hypothetical protein